MTQRPLSVAAGALAVACALAACTAGGDGSASSAPPELPPPAVTVPEQSLGVDVAMRLADDVVPPTNRWYSSLAFGDPGLPVFPKPLSFAPSEGGFTMGLTRPAASAQAIMAPASADLSVTVMGAAGYGVVSHADPVAVGISMGDVEVTLAQGWPVVGVMADAAATMTLGSPFVAAGEGIGEAAINGTQYAVVVRDGVIDGTTIQLDEGGSAQFFAVPNGGDVKAFADALGDPVHAAEWTGKVSQPSASTSLTYGAKTVVAVPSWRADGLDCELGTYATIDGEFEVCAAGQVSWDVPAVAPSGELDLSRITDDQREAIITALKGDVAALPAVPSDSYFGGKALYRMANLLTIATELGEEEAAETVRAALAEALGEWGTADRCASGEARCFVYDPMLRGVVGVTPAFGSEDFNDHHFHYGYLLYAAAVASADDPALGEAIGPVFDQVAADIASADIAAASGASPDFPAIRTFDPAAGHSWASGFAPFADGNNQESSSEAVSAWNAVALWAEVRGNAALEARATWMLSLEADTARRLWLAPDLAAFPEYEHSIVAMEWGAKRDYATWFSPEPSAMLGIQLIPMAPFSVAYLSAIDAGHIATTIAEAGAPAQFGDYILMYQALQGLEARSESWTAALNLPPGAIDDGNSRTYLLAYIAALDS
ncbi:glycosyl hydrolase [Demequina sp.]|uniref:glycosyl hydrolase n=1 Tax=Demequina sp. TaxID=2050685 RepID=UPI003D0B9C2B